MWKHVAGLVALAVLGLAACRPEPRLPTAPLPTPESPPPPPGAPADGTYQLTVDVGASCPAVPAAERLRRYTATWDRPAGDGLVTLTGASFLTGLICTGGSGRYAGVGCHQFFSSVAGDTVTFTLENNNDEAHGGHIVEHLPSGGWIEIIGKAAGRTGAATIDAVGSGSVWYCPTPSSYPFPCRSFVSCPATELRVTVTR